MTLYKKNNGKRIPLSEEEETQIVEMWQENIIKKKDLAWLRGRKREYPSIQGQLDMLWHELDIYGSIEKAGPWYAAIKAVKDKHPKPE